MSSVHHTERKESVISIMLIQETHHSDYAPCCCHDAEGKNGFGMGPKLWKRHVTELTGGGCVFSNEFRNIVVGINILLKELRDTI